MARKIKRAAVIGGGVMGSGIAAHLAGVGIETLLLDIVPPDLSGKDLDDKQARNRFARSGVQNALKAKPPAFYNPDDAALIRVGNLEDDLPLLADCDWIVEAVVENLAIKQKLFARIDEVRKPGTIVTSNTSGLKIAEMVAGRSDDFVRCFFVTHFFNPVRFMRLLELVAGERTDPQVFAEMARFGADVLGKGIVFGKDTPNFVANRIGTYAMMYALHAMERDGFTVEEIDAVFGPVTGRPKSAVFRTADIVGLDTLVHVANNCYDALVDDPYRDTFKVPGFLKDMVSRGWLGQKTKGGFYKKVGSEIQALDVKSMAYKPSQKIRTPAIGAVKGIEDAGQRIKAFVENSDDRLAKLAWEVTAHTLPYAAMLIGEIADDVVNVDNAMKWGFNWELGPFETWDAIGVAQSVARMQAEGIEVPAKVLQLLERGATSFYAGSVAQPTYYDFGRGAQTPQPQDERQIRLGALRERGKVIKQNAGTTIYDAGDGVLLLEFHTKMNAVDDDVIRGLQDAVKMAEDEGWAGVVIGNEHKDAFSAGANLFGVAMAIKGGQWQPLEQMIAAFQQANLRLRYSDVPVVAAPAGLALGGGAEMVMSCDAVRAHAELYMGLVEVGVGLLPAAGGCLCQLERWLGHMPDDPSLDPVPYLQQAFQNIAMAKVSVGAEEAARMRLLRPHDRITLNRDLLLHDAKQTVLGLARAGYRRPRPVLFRLPGASGSAVFNWFVENMRLGGHVSEHDSKIAAKIANVLCGGDTSMRVKVSQQRILDLEREAFLSLCGEEKTQARIEHMLTKNKPLRN